MKQPNRSLRVAAPLLLAFTLMALGSLFLVAEPASADVCYSCNSLNRCWFAEQGTWGNKKCTHTQHGCYAHGDACYVPVPGDDPEIGGGGGGGGGGGSCVKVDGHCPAECFSCVDPWF